MVFSFNLLSSHILSHCAHSTYRYIRHVCACVESVCVVCGWSNWVEPRRRCMCVQFVRGSTFSFAPFWCGIRFIRFLWRSSFLRRLRFFIRFIVRLCVCVESCINYYIWCAVSVWLWFSCDSDVHRLELWSVFQKCFFLTLIFCLPTVNLKKWRTDSIDWNIVASKLLFRLRGCYSVVSESSWYRSNDR